MRRSDLVAPNTSRAGRRSSVELLRIIAMMLIVLSHLCVHSPWDVGVGVQNEYLIDVMSLGEVGVVIFVLITGFFSYKSMRFRASGLFRVMLQVQFYSIGCYLIAKAVHFDGDFERFSPFPILTGSYWFVTVWAALYVASPLMARFVSSLDPKAHRNLLVCLFVALCMVPLLLNVSFIYSKFLYFVFLYLLGAYWGKYGNPLSSMCFYSKALVVMTAWLLISILIMIARRYGSLPFLEASPKDLIALNSLPVLLLGSFIFLAVESSDLGVNRLINTLGSTAFGVYLLSDNYLIRPMLWRGMSGFFDGVESPVAFLLSCLLVSGAVFLVCSLVDWLRLHLLEIPFFGAFSPQVDRLDKWASRLF